MLHKLNKGLKLQLAKNIDKGDKLIYLSMELKMLIRVKCILLMIHTRVVIEMSRSKKTKGEEHIHHKVLQDRKFKRF
jgi:hypothetical protein